MAQMAQTFEFEVGPEETGMRADAFAAAHCPDLTRSAAARLMDKQCILRNGSPVVKKMCIRDRCHMPGCNGYERDRCCVRRFRCAELSA